MAQRSSSQSALKEPWCSSYALYALQFMYEQFTFMYQNMSINFLFFQGRSLFMLFMLRVGNTGLNRMVWDINKQPEWMNWTDEAPVQTSKSASVAEEGHAIQSLHDTCQEAFVTKCTSTRGNKEEKRPLRIILAGSELLSFPSWLAPSAFFSASPRGC